MRKVHIGELLAQLIVEHGLVAEVVRGYLGAQEVILADAFHFLAQFLLNARFSQVEQVVLQDDSFAAAVSRTIVF